jgi:hypothetical protein
VQIWPDGKKPKWAADGFTGNLTYWMTGSTSVDTMHSGIANRHPDYRHEFQWKPLDEVAQRLAHEAGGWEDDAKTRLAILQAHQKINEPQKAAEPEGIQLRLPTLHAVIG